MFTAGGELPINLDLLWSYSSLSPAANGRSFTLNGSSSPLDGILLSQARWNCPKMLIESCKPLTCFIGLLPLF